MKDNENFIERMMQGVPVKVSENERLIIVTPNMTAKQYAAIKLRVPRSGAPEIDAMIRESRRADFMEKAMTGMMACGYVPQEARELSEAMLAEWEKGSKGEA
jgi:hypothetical protein